MKTSPVFRFNSTQVKKMNVGRNVGRILQSGADWRSDTGQNNDSHPRKLFEFCVYLNLIGPRVLQTRHSISYCHLTDIKCKV